MASPLDLRDWLPSAAGGLFAGLIDLAPWEITAQADAIIRRALATLQNYSIHDGVAVHRAATVEPGAVLKAPAIIGPNSFIASGAYLRGGVLLDEDCIVGPSCELKSVFMLARSKIAHLSFIGDSIIGAGANIEAGAIIANYRNERADKRIRIVLDGETLDTGVEKFGALIGDGARIGAGAVIAPGALIRPGAIVKRLSLVDHSD